MAAKQYKKSIFIFRRDLRLHDNMGLLAACAQSDTVLPIFIFDTRQVGVANDYRSMHAIQFMIESLQDLHEQLNKKGSKLFLFYGEPTKIIQKLSKDFDVDAVFCNRDYTPFSINRDKDIERLCHKLGVAFNQYGDYLLHEPQDALKSDNTPYSVFTPFYKNAVRLGVAKPQQCRATNFFGGTLTGAEKHADIYKKVLKTTNDDLAVHGGTQKAKNILRGIQSYKNYAKTRDIPAQDATTHLSAYIKFGCVSIREVYHTIQDKLGAQHPLLRQLYWRDFFTHVAYYSPFVFGQPYHQKYKKLKWSQSKKDFDRWCTGTTGFPIVDAGMRQLNATGYMHNRVRMIVASFLTKDLHINWLWGEQYFAQQLVDYDPCVNNGSWQWAASTGCDAQPYFRIFNPWLQQKKFDPDCAYIKEWVPELEDVDAKIIHSWYKESHSDIPEYPCPMVDHTRESKLAKMLYKNV